MARYLLQPKPAGGKLIISSKLHKLHEKFDLSLHSSNQIPDCL